MFVHPRPDVPGRMDCIGTAVQAPLHGRDFISVGLGPLYEEGWRSAGQQNAGGCQAIARGSMDEKPDSTPRPGPSAPGQKKGSATGVALPRDEARSTPRWSLIKTPQFVIVAMANTGDPAL